MIAQRNYDPFGKPRLASGGLMPVGNAKLNDLADAKTRRGFTDHEHLDDIELIHMNGRVYDYNLGRFMSVDPVIQSPTNSQSINPYSYIMNNPLAGIDPTGYTGCAASRIESACESLGSSFGGYDTNYGAEAQAYGNASLAVANSTASVGNNISNGLDQSLALASSKLDSMDIGSLQNIEQGSNRELSNEQLSQIYSDTAETIGDAAIASIVNLFPDMVNGTIDWTERFLHQESGSLGRVGQIVEVDNEVTQEVVNDFRKVGSVLLANTPLRASTPASMRLPSGGLSGNLVAQPKLIWGLNAEQIAASLTAEGYQVALSQSKRGAGNAIIIKVEGHKQLTQIQVHSGGGRHGGAYYKISTSTQGKVWVVDPATFRADPTQKGTIVSGVN